MTLRVVPEGLAAASAAVEALTARLAAAHAAAAPAITAVVPPAADPVSLQTAAGFSAQGEEHVAVAAQGVEELGRAGVGVGEGPDGGPVGLAGGVDVEEGDAGGAGAAEHGGEMGGQARVLEVAVGVGPGEILRVRSRRGC